MPRFLRLQASFVLFLVWASSACHKKQVSVPLPPPAVTKQPEAPEPSPAAATSETPVPNPSPVTSTHPAEPTPYQVNKPPQPAPAVKKPVRSATAPAAGSTPAPPPAPAPAAPAPKLGDVLTDDEQKQYSAAIDQSIGRAQGSLNSIGGRQLTKEQQAEVEQIRNFIQQAQNARGSDASGAKSLAERAEVLARDLAATFH